MVIGFKPQFEPKIQAGTKIHTIREDAHDRWRAGMKMHMATGVRTKNYRCFETKECTGVQEIYICRNSDYLEQTIVKVDGKVLTQNEVQQLAWGDGFSCLIDFWQWFAFKESNPFKGKIIHWTDKRY
jgi:hypothetical protein